ncbi:methyltransferase [Lysobacter sp. CA199]|uniref:methyltransferase n=1 Tax=Lysobacter sp. CA199 TaxID=3455608 RepID=UPI003F8CF5C8
MTTLAETTNPATAILSELERLDRQPALIDGDRRWSGAQVLEAGASAAGWLSARGVGVGSVLRWNADDCASALFARLAALRLGAVWSQRDDEAITLHIDAADTLAMLQHAPFTDIDSDVDGEEDGAESVALPSAPFDGRPERVAVLLPLIGRGGDIALAAWQIGACVHIAAQTSTAKTLTWLERSGADHVAAPAAVWGALLAHPALALSDLSRLRRCLCENPSAEEREQLRKQLGCELVALAETSMGAEHIAQITEALRAHAHLADAAAVVCADATTVAYVVPGPRESTAAVPPTDLQEQSAIAVDTALAGTDAAGAVAATEALSRTALYSMLGALQRCGLFADTQQTHDAKTVLSRARVASAHRRLIRRWLKVLHEQGLLHCDDGHYRLADSAPDCSDTAMRAAWDSVERDWRANAEASGTIDYARRNAERLPQLIAGELNAVHLLFPEGRSDLARALYRESIAARYQHKSVAALVTMLARRSERPLRLLEVGAGTGATSETVLPALRDLPVDYLYTDVSRYFIEQAATRLHDYPRLRFGLYDIDRPGREQGYASNRFDVIVAGGVLNAARNTDASLRWLGELLRPGGWLLLTEPTVEEFWVMASQALMLVDADDDRADSQATFLSWTQWRQALDQAGFERKVDLPPPGHALERLGHRVFAAQAKTDRHAPDEARLRAELGALGQALSRIDAIDALPLRADGAPDTDLLRRWAEQPAAAALSPSDLRGPQ